PGRIRRGAPGPPDAGEVAQDLPCGNPRGDGAPAAPVRVDEPGPVLVRSGASRPGPAHRLRDRRGLRPPGSRGWRIPDSGPDPDLRTTGNRRWDYHLARCGAAAIRRLPEAPTAPASDPTNPPPGGDHGPGRRGGPRGRSRA